MSKFYKHKEFGYIVCTDAATEDHVYVTFPGGITARLDMTSAEFDAQFVPCKTRVVDLNYTVLGHSGLDLYFGEYVPDGFPGSDRRRKIVVSYDEIIEAFLPRAFVLHEAIQPKE